jgi:hypothetical protein
MFPCSSIYCAHSGVRTLTELVRPYRLVWVTLRSLGATVAASEAMAH